MPDETGCLADYGDELKARGWIVIAEIRDRLAELDEPVTAAHFAEHCRYFWYRPDGPEYLSLRCAVYNARSGIANKTGVPLARHYISWSAFHSWITTYEYQKPIKPKPPTNLTLF